MQHYQRIRDLREDSDLTQEALCKKLYMHKTTYTNYEQGKHTVPLDFAVLLADFYGVSIDYIAGRTNNPGDSHSLSLPDDTLNVLEKYTALTERNKGRLEQFLDTLYEQQAQQKEAQ
ncbi:helix-turn-helix transcriptional regulator [Ruminococcus sp.]|uniref:helix-turn-helix domain-containing protein n=1 Tax=Ruminococcus sp. TaxID=41978 RepID=UPI00344A7477